MKLLFDENLSASLVHLLEDIFPSSSHVSAAGETGMPDSRVWSIARENGYAIVSKDNDFRQRSFLEGSPPKVVWLSIGNAGTSAIAKLLRDRHQDLIRFNEDPDASLLVVSAEK